MERPEEGQVREHLHKLYDHLGGELREQLVDYLIIRLFEEREDGSALIDNYVDRPEGLYTLDGRKVLAFNMNDPSLTQFTTLGTATPIDQLAPQTPIVQEGHGLPEVAKRDNQIEL